LTYSYDLAGRRFLMLAEDGSRTSYGFDMSGQLIREQRTTGMMQVNATYMYDPVGNRVLLLDSGVPTTSSYDAANQLTLSISPSSRTTYLYDQAGNRTQKSGKPTTTLPVSAQRTIINFCCEASNRPRGGLHSIGSPRRCSARMAAA